MAVLESIRRRGGIIAIAIIGLAVLVLVIGDSISPEGSRVRSSDIAKVGGKTLSVHQFQIKLNEITSGYQRQFGHLDEQMSDMVHEQAWRDFIDEELMQQAYARIGLTVSALEFRDIIFGFNPPPILRQIQAFSNPQTGEFDRNALREFLNYKDSDPNYAADWLFLERSILDDRYRQKYNELIGKGIFVPDFMAENENHEQNRTVDFDYIVQGYDIIADSLIVVTNNDLKAYYQKNINRWQQTASRDIEFVVFNVVPSAEDRIAAQEWIENIRSDFEESADPFQFIRINTRLAADTRFLTREQLPLQVIDLFDQPVGAMSVPYQDGETFKLARLLKSENRPDSINVRQIVLVPKAQTQASYNEAVILSDSIKTAIEQGADFAMLAAQYSADTNTANVGGVVGWMYDFNVQGSEMESLFDIARGEVSAFTFPGQGVIVMQVTERGAEVKKVQIATLQRDILPSVQTEDLIFSQASAFSVENRSEKQFNDAVAEQNLFKRTATRLGENDRQIPGFASARQIVRWAYNAKQGEVSDVFTLDNNSTHIVAILKNIHKKGFAPMDDVIVEIDMNVRREKKGEQIAAQLSEAAQNAQSFFELANSLNLPIETANGITFSTFSIPGAAGIEPELIAVATNAFEGNISRPVKGFNGVYLFTVNQIVEPDEISIQQARERLAITYFNRTMPEAMEALRKAANIKDMRSKFTF